MHGGGWANSQILGATTEATCEYFERGLLHPEVDYETPPRHLKAICDPLDEEGNVILPQTPVSGWSSTGTTSRKTGSATEENRRLTN